jgi:hypothetical protein
MTHLDAPIELAASPVNDRDAFRGQVFSELDFSQVYLGGYHVQLRRRLGWLD